MQRRRTRDGMRVVQAKIPCLCTLGLDGRRCGATEAVLPVHLSGWNFLLSAGPRLMFLRHAEEIRSVQTGVAG